MTDEIADYARRVVDAAPPLTAAQRSRLAALLAESRRRGGNDQETAGAGAGRGRP